MVPTLSQAYCNRCRKLQHWTKDKTPNIMEFISQTELTISFWQISCSTFLLLLLLELALSTSSFSQKLGVILDLANSCQLYFLNYLLTPLPSLHFHLPFVSSSTSVQYFSLWKYKCDVVSLVLKSFMSSMPFRAWLLLFQCPFPPLLHRNLGFCLP